ncbi:MAG: aminoglycoside 6-adenylyltransferase [Bdellovibrionota bacterium]|nr:aminoglycoside 6-adenylyltransferase [Bdellovibrionota bacterium]
MNELAFKNMEELPLHKNLCRFLADFFLNQTGVGGVFLSGSAASGEMDRFSDLDIGIVCLDDDLRENVWANRFRWNFSSWFHRMDADHIKSHFIIYIFEPDIHVDINFYTYNDLPGEFESPYLVVEDKAGKLPAWAKSINRKNEIQADWSRVDHEQARFWVCVHYTWAHCSRGELYDCAVFVKDIRSIIENWFARLNGEAFFNSRKIEKRLGSELSDQMIECFPGLDKTEIKAALLQLISLENIYQKKIEENQQVEWSTTQEAKNRIRKLVEDL